MGKLELLAGARQIMRVCIPSQVLCSSGTRNTAENMTNSTIIWKNCAIDDTSMKFGTQLVGVFRKIFGCRDIADSSCDQNGRYFPKWPPKTYLTVLSSCIK